MEFMCLGEGIGLFAHQCHTFLGARETGALMVNCTGGTEPEPMLESTQGPRGRHGQKEERENKTSEKTRNWKLGKDNGKMGPNPRIPSQSWASVQD